MKVVDKQLVFINSSDRDSGEIQDFHISIPSHLLTCQSHQKMRMILNDLVLPYTWYNVQEANRYLHLEENGGALSQVALDLGSYNALQLQTHLQSKLNEAGNHTYVVTFDEIAAKFKFTITTVHNSTNSLQFTKTTNGVNSSAYKLLGFDKGSTNHFATFTNVPLNTTTYELTSSKTITTMFADALHFHCDLLNTNVDKMVGDESTFHLSNVFAKVMIDTSPFNNIIFQNRNDDFLINITSKRLTGMRFWFTTSDHTPIDMNDDFSFTLKVEVLEDDEKTLIQQNSGLGELMRLLLLQQHHVAKVQKSSD